MFRKNYGSSGRGLYHALGGNVGPSNVCHRGRTWLRGPPPPSSWANVLASSPQSPPPSHGSARSPGIPVLQVNSDGKASEVPFNCGVN